MFSWIAGMGLVAKIALGAGVAVAATAGAGAAGVLPVGAQDAFDTVVSTVVPATQVDHSTEVGTDNGSSAPDPASTDRPDNFGGSVSERAKDSEKVGSTFGQETSQAAHMKENGRATSTEGHGDVKGSTSSDGSVGGDGTVDQHLSVDGSGSVSVGDQGKAQDKPGKP